MRTSSVLRPVARICGVAVLILTALYVLLALLPFYANGIHLRTPAEITGSAVDVKGYPPFAWFGGAGPLQGVAMLTAGFVPFTTLPLAFAQGLLVTLKWRAFAAAERVLWLGVAIANLATFALTWQARGLILTWLVD